LDDTSVVDTSNSAVQLLQNPNFENSSTSPTYWTIWCTSSCVNGTGGTIVSTDCHSGYCYRSECAGTEYLGQTFSATVGHIYNVTFWYQRVKIGGGNIAETLYAGII